MHLEKHISHTFQPLSLDEGICHAHIERFVAHRNTGLGNLRRTHQRIPVAQSISHEPARWIDFRNSCARRWARQHEKIFGVGNEAMNTHASKLYPLRKRLARTLP